MSGRSAIHKDTLILPSLLGLALVLCLALSACGAPPGAATATRTPAPRATATPAVMLDPALAEMSVYISSYTPGAAFALNARTGSIRWSAQTGVMYGSQAVANGIVYTSRATAPRLTRSMPRSVYALNATTGALAWSTSIGAQVYAAPVVAP